MRIKEAAVMCNGKMWTGRRHGTIIQEIAKKIEGRILIRQNQQGFVTECGKFVGRGEAADIALEAGQISKRVDVLMSEDLY